MSRTIADLTPGTLIYLDETVSGTTTHTPYCYLGIDENGKARVLRKIGINGKRMHNKATASYAGCEMDVFLENESTGFLSRFDSNTINALAYTTIKYVDYTLNNDNTPEIAETSRRCFLLSYSERGFGNHTAGNEGASIRSVLQAFYGRSDGYERSAPNASETGYIVTWIRTARSVNDFYYANGNSGGGNTATLDAYGYQPTLSFAPTTPVSDVGTESIFLLPDGRVTTWSIDMKMKVGESANRPSKAKINLPISSISSLSIQVTNNYADINPTWVSINNGSSAILSNTSKTSTYWEVGVKIQAEASNPLGYIGEPIVLIETDVS